MLLDLVDTSLSAEAAGDLLTMAGFELEGIEEVGGEPVLDIKVMSNRGDGLSMLGLAREVLAKDELAKPTDLYTSLTQRTNPTTSQASPLVRIETPDCNRYACCIFLNLPRAESPEWLRSRLKKAGMRSISFVVDLTNYVMLELGQPLHAFDLDKLEGKRIVVRKARPGEKLRTLDGAEHELREGQMMICDEVKPVAAAGIMGGEETEVSTGTSNVLLEAAHFDPLSVRRTRKQLGLNTEASYRYERSVDPEGVVRGIERFCDLLGVQSSEIVDVYPGKLHRAPVSVRVSRAKMLLGMDLQLGQAKRYLERLGMEVSGHGEPFFVVAPTWRPDIVQEEDLVEELGRVHGYEQIPELLPSGRTILALPGEIYQQIDRIRDSVLRHGYNQAINHSLQATHPLDRKAPMVGPRTPSSPEYALLRNSLLPGLAETFQKNGAKNLHFFELANVFAETVNGVVEQWRSLAFMSSGDLLPSYRKGEAVPQANFFSLKGDILETLADLGKTVTLTVPAQLDHRFHSTRQAEVSASGNAIGILGQLHPELAESLRLEPETIAAELNLDALLNSSTATVKLRSVSRNPAVKRDIALLIERSVPYSQIESTIREVASEVLEAVDLFDEFAGEGIPAGKHSLGITLQLRKMGENFTDQEANQVRDKVVEALVELGGSTR